MPIRPLLQRYSAVRILTYEMLIGTAILLPFAVPGMLAQDYAGVSLAGWGSLGYAVVFSGIATNLLDFTAIGRVGASRAALYQYLQSFLAVLFAVVLLGEHVTLVQGARGSRRGGGHHRRSVQDRTTAAVPTPGAHRFGRLSGPRFTRLHGTIPRWCAAQTIAA